MSNTQPTTEEELPTSEEEQLDVEEIIAEARRPERRVTVCMRADLNARFDELQEQLENTEAGEETLAGERPDGGPGRRTIARQIEELREQMQAHSRTFRVRAMPRTEFWDFDRQRRESPRGLPDGYVEALVARCMVNPPITEEEQVKRLFDVLGNSQADAIFYKCWEANTASVDVPKSWMASQILGEQRSE